MDTKNTRSKKELIEIILDSCPNMTISIGDMFTNGTTAIEFSGSSANLLKGSICFSSSEDVNAILGICECSEGANLHSLEHLEKATQRINQMFKSDFSLFITNEKKGKVSICARSNSRTYLTTIEIKGEDHKYDLSQVRYHALYELTKLVYNEINQAIPPKERKICLYGR